MNRAREKPVKVGLLQSYRRSARSLSSCISATPMPASLAAPSARCASCGPISAALSATLSARSRNPLIEAAFAPLLALARRVRDQEHGQRDSNVYSLPPRSNASAKASRTSPTSSVSRSASPRRLSATSAGSSPSQALPGNPYDGHTLGRIIPAIEQLLGNTIERLHVDAGYRGHNAPIERP